MKSFFERLLELLISAGLIISVLPMIIIGGKNSSNTKKLYEVSKHNNENTFIVHGHTPVQYMNERLNIKEDTHIYCEGHKIDLDCWTAQSHATVLLNLDTLTLIPFVEDIEEE